MVTTTLIARMEKALAEDQGTPALSTRSWPTAAEALLVLALRKGASSPVVWVADGPQTLETLHRDLITLGGTDPTGILYYPSMEAPASASSRHATRTASGAPEPRPVDPEVVGQRIDVLMRLSEALTRTPPPRAPAIVTCVQALMQKTYRPESLARETVTVSVATEQDPESVVQMLTRNRYSFTNEVLQRCDASLRGGILDVWPPAEPWPLRIEFLGNTVESIRSFDPADQRSRDRKERVVLTPASELRLAGEPTVSLLDYLPPQSTMVWSRFGNIAEHAGMFEETSSANDADDALTFDALYRRVEAGGHLQLFAGGTLHDEEGPAGRVTLPEPVRLEIDMAPVEGVYAMPRDALVPDVLEKARRRVLDDLVARSERGHAVCLFFDTPASREHFREQVGRRTLPDAVHLLVGPLSSGFLSESLTIAVAAESDFFGRRRIGLRRYDPHPDRARPERDIGLRVSDLTDMEPGDLVVHIEHGIGRYRGLAEILFNGQRQEVISIEYADKARLHVPVSHAHLLSRYVGVARQNPPLHRLGGKRWNSEMAAAQAAIADLSATLLETQAQRDTLAGFAFPTDTAWQSQFEAAFPYVETPDQRSTILAVKNDMESSRPMDRLVCGDAGYGKTEVAMRAAFKAVMSGRQVAVLVPTTVLAQQHFDTFRERMSAYPMRIEMLSRFCSQAQHDRTLLDMKDGTVDIVIGTHSLVQEKVEFKDLGLVIVDEEQRFGVTHKERLKELRRLVDVMTLTATPIPRTLYMSMMGARDMSLIQTPPNERMAIETIVAPNTDTVVRDAILRELNREGQVFYLHNRIATIEMVKARLHQLVPEARIAVAHGQMATSELAVVVEQFAAGAHDILLCTTIVENGMDIPRANTILIDRADRFGIADLYQLRGRVGRSNRKAYAYLLVPPHGHIDSDARKRIGAVEQHSGLGSGFYLALRDLEIRGAGNLLGAQQSGHITAIGFGLYCQLLRRTVAKNKGEPLPEIVDVEVSLDFVSFARDASDEIAAVLPYTYIEDERQRISAYRRIAEATTEAEVARVKDDLRDRFGPLPRETSRLLMLGRLRVAAAPHRIRRVEVREEKIMLFRDGDYLLEHSRFPRLKPGTADRQLDELLRWVRNVEKWAG